MFKKVIPVTLMCALVAPAAFAAPRPTAAKAKPVAKTPLRPNGASVAKPAAAPKPAATPAPAAAPTAAPMASKPAGWRAEKAAWSGFFFDFNVGYGAVSGEDGPQIPDAANSTRTILLSSLPKSRYDQAVTTNVGSGLAAGLTIGYNIKGYVSLAVDLGWQGSLLGGKTDMSGIGTGSFMLGLHPLRFWRKNLDFDLKLYGGFGVYEIAYYYENQLQSEAEGKSWLGTSIPLGATVFYRIPGSAFVIGVDLRQTLSTYSTWMYNWDDDIKSEPDPALNPSRFSGRLVLGGHF